MTVPPNPSLRKYRYRRTLPHILDEDSPVFVTFHSHKRWWLPEPARILVLDACLSVHMTKAELFAAVVMPDHVHLVFRPLRDSDGALFSLPEIMHSIKGRSAHAINRLLGRRGPVWQDECFDHVPRRTEKLREKIYYVLNNPVRKELVKRWQDYPWAWKSEKIE